MKDLFADRMSKVPKSFVREILKVTEDSNIISFGGGLPNPDSFPHTEIAEAASKVLTLESREALQYSTTEGYKPLREYIAQRYCKGGLKVDADEILITNGSQQGLDLVGKVFLNKDDGVVVEHPTYLAAIQAFGMYEPKFHSVKLMEDGPDTVALENLLKKEKPKLFYCVPNFQNPTGISYSEDKRREVAGILRESGTVLVEDNPYGEIRFMGKDLPPIKKFLPDSVLLGSFSKVVAPGIRLGWVAAGEEVMDKLVTAKQASDLHSNYLAQRIVHGFLTQYDVEKHLDKIRTMYRRQRDLMVNSIEKYFPDGVTCTKPEGGMFLWVTLPEGVSSMELFDLAIKENVAFVPGKAFYAEDPEINTMRLNFSNSNEEKIVEGIKRLANALEKIL
ncbi:PLP-dependent aminotransferase family protein [Methanobacterium aggregans]|uniref:aminotransferase-like domain-containing protein n=1 Tax=Methanobacterium aggregans TaxID=1615586 RepID=UPI001AE16698|nr:PLP-dependent aminotransferase family protein [Methanobacterium aggregans]MBP2044829.1 2-aminoadipate transaminase [Methanobacterium aggregans]